MKRWNQTDYAWAAGFIDGEGSFSVTYHAKKHHYAMEFQVGQVDRSVLDWLQLMFGGSLERRKIRKAFPNAKPIWIWRCRGVQAERAIENLLPYLRLKRERAELFLRMRRSIRLRRACYRNPLSAKEMKQRLKIVSRMEELNKRGAA